MNKSSPAGFNFSCPLGTDTDDKVLLAHGGGGSLSQRLIRDVITPIFASPWLEHLPDGARLIGRHEGKHRPMVVTTDSFVVKPLFFPGGNIGSLAATGTINDLAVMGACPEWLTCSVIIEEGFSKRDLMVILKDLAQVARSCGMHVVTGDTKVVGRGQGDGLFINTTGIGYQETDQNIGPDRIKPGDAIILSGDIGRHGTAILCAREDFKVESPVTSDAAELWTTISAILKAGIPVHCMRDLTRGGLAAALSEISGSANLPMTIHEDRIPVCIAVQSVCEIFGLDPLHLANEGRFIAIVPEFAVDHLINLLSASCKDENSKPSVIGWVQGGTKSGVTIRTEFGGDRPLILPSGDPIPRIC